MTVADAHVALGELDEAFRWYRHAIEAGGLHRSAVALQAATLARGAGRPQLVSDFLAIACRDGVLAACRAERKLPRPSRGRPSHQG